MKRTMVDRIITPIDFLYIFLFDKSVIKGEKKRRNFWASEEKIESLKSLSDHNFSEPAFDHRNHMFLKSRNSKKRSDTSLILNVRGLPVFLK